MCLGQSLEVNRKKKAFARGRDWDTYAKSVYSDSLFAARPPTVTQVPALAEVEEVVASNNRKL